MRDQFTEFYAPTPDEMKRFLTEAVVIPDANILLGLYQLSTPQRNEVLTALDAVSDRLWLPYQAGLEYQRNRMGVIRAQASAYQALLKLHGVQTTTEMSEALKGKALPDDVKSAVEPLLETLHIALTESAAEYHNAVESITSQHVVTVDQGLNDDPVRRRLDGLFDGRTGTALSESVHAERVKQSKTRYAAKVPPGYKDANKDTDEGAAGDYLIWAEILDYAATIEADGKPVLFVTADVKEDWFERSGGLPVGPRPELAREFATRNTHGYSQVSLPEFLRLTNEHLDTAVPDTTIIRAGELSREVGRRLVLDVLSRHGHKKVVDIPTWSGVIDPEMFRRVTPAVVDPALMQSIIRLNLEQPDVFWRTAMQLRDEWNIDDSTPDYDADSGDSDDSDD